MPILENAFDKATPETLLFWTQFLKFTLFRRDPRRYRPLIEMILSQRPDPKNSSFFEESRKLFFIREVLAYSSFQLGLDQIQTLQKMLIAPANLCSPYKQVRDVLGNVTNELFELQCSPGFLTVDDVVAHCARVHGEGLGYGGSLPSDMTSSINQLSQQIDTWKAKDVAAGIPNSKVGSTEYSNACKLGEYFIIFVVHM
jgi:proteasome activator subunit 4